MEKSINDFSSLLITLLITLLTTGCAMTQGNSSRLCANDDADLCKSEEISPIAKEIARDSNLFKPDDNFQTLNEYTEQMVHILYQKVSQQNIEKAIAVPPFIYLSSTEEVNQQPNVSVAEAFVVDMQNMCLPVAVFILTHYPDFSLTNSSDFGYLLKGTMRERESGTMVYAKIIDVKTKMVIAATSKLLPKYLLSPLK